jgi:ABC-type antimicrobial peptide transport system permease subunit
MEIIGIVKDIKYRNLRTDIPYQAYVPTLAARVQGGLTTFVRTAAQPDAMYSAIRAKLRELEPNLPVNSLRTVEEDVSDSLVTERMTASLSAVFGFLATGLAVIGLYGVMAYSVARRTREIGIRVALGAGERNVIWMVMREVLILVGVGVAIALPAAFALTGLVRAQLFGVAPNDPWTLAIATLALTAVACAAGYIPALRASRINPILALRND